MQEGRNLHFHRFQGDGFCFCVLGMLNLLSEICFERNTRGAVERS